MIAVNPADFIGRHGSLPLPRLLGHLRRHGIAAHCVELAGVPAAAIADALQEQANIAGADLLVAGAHGHLWLRDMLLGQRHARPLARSATARHDVEAERPRRRVGPGCP